jgi:fermentation-respiration switch protein FrsA (DUF1100 family)
VNLPAWLFQLLFIGGAMYLLALGVLYFSQDRLVFLPHVAGRALIGSPADIGLDYQEVWLDTEDGERLHAWWVPAETSRASLLFFHGNAGNISHRLGSIRQFHDLGLDVFILDYRGYGRSSGKPSEQGLARDARAAWAHLSTRARGHPHRIVVFGRSLGGGVAAALAAEPDVRPAALILESTFTSVPDMGAELYPLFPVRLLSRIEFDTLGHIESLDLPVLIVHSPDDEIVPYHHAQTLQAAAPQSRLLDLRGGHNDGHRVSPDYLPGLDRFLESVLEGGAAPGRP